jgi:hypothetical protein
MKDERTGLQKLSDEENFNYASICLAIQVMAASLFYWIFFG